jgi:hypothetical protein
MSVWQQTSDRHRKTHVRYGEVGMIMDNSGDDSMIENLTAEYVDEISSEMVDLTNTGEEEGDTSRDMSGDVNSNFLKISFRTHCNKILTCGYIYEISVTEHP